MTCCIVLLIGLPMTILIFRGRGWDFWFNGTLSLGEFNIKMDNCSRPFGTAFFRTGDILWIWLIYALSNIPSHQWHHVVADEWLAEYALYWHKIGTKFFRTGGWLRLLIYIYIYISPDGLDWHRILSNWWFTDSDDWW